MKKPTKPFDLSLYLVTDRMLSHGRSLEYIVSEAVKGGVTMVQLREKSSSTWEFITIARAVKQLLSPTGIPLIINDNVDVALAVEAEGLHIGQGDIPYAKARQLMGSGAIIGLSVENYDQAVEADQLDLDYIGISPVFLTETKHDTAAALGFEGIAQIKMLCKHPAVAIGGINLSNTSQIIKAGADGIAVVSAICSAADPRAATEMLRQKVDAAKKQYKL